MQMGLLSRKITWFRHGMYWVVWQIDNPYRSDIFWGLRAPLSDSTSKKYAIERTYSIWPHKFKVCEITHRTKSN